MANKIMVVFDNQGKTFDRYTLIRSDGETWGASDDPYAPNGFGMYTGNMGDDYFNKTFGYSWQNNRSVKQIGSMVRDETKKQIEQARSEPSWLGVEVKDHSTLPEDVQKYIAQLLKE